MKTKRIKSARSKIQVQLQLYINNNKSNIGPDKRGYPHKIFSNFSMVTCASNEYLQHMFHEEIG